MFTDRRSCFTLVVPDDPEGDFPLRQGLHKNLHATTETMNSRKGTLPAFC